jgi:signal transduction histidine kinase
MKPIQQPRKGTRPVGLWIALAALACVALVSYRTTSVQTDNARWTEHTHEVIDGANGLLTALSEAGSAKRTFVIDGNERWLADYPGALRKVAEAQASVRSLTSDNANEQRRLDRLEPLVKKRLTTLEQSIALRRTNPFDTLHEAEVTREGAAVSDEIRQIVRDLIGEERSLLSEREARAATSATYAKSAQVIGTTVSLVIILLAFAGLRREIARRTTAMEELRAAVDTAVAARKELEAFSYSVAHDLRAPLRTIDGFSQALLEDCGDKLDAQNREHLGRVRRAAARMAQVIDDLLALSRVTRSELRLAKVDLTALARSVATQLESAQPNRHTTFVIEEGLQAQADANLVRIALENLLGNAWKFTSKNPTAHIEFGAAPSIASHEYFVRDDGAGFDMAHAGKLFGVFQRLHTTDDFDGTGIGLATVQRIVERHGGRIWADSEVNRGATFHFTLESLESSRGPS